MTQNTSMSVDEYFTEIEFSSLTGFQLQLLLRKKNPKANQIHNMHCTYRLTITDVQKHKNRQHYVQTKHAQRRLRIQDFLNTFIRFQRFMGVGCNWTDTPPQDFEFKILDLINMPFCVLIKLEELFWFIVWLGVVCWVVTCGVTGNINCGFYISFLVCNCDFPRQMTRKFLHQYWLDYFIPEIRERQRDSDR